MKLPLHNLVCQPAYDGISISVLSIALLFLLVLTHLVFLISILPAPPKFEIKLMKWNIDEMNSNMAIEIEK